MKIKLFFITLIASLTVAHAQNNTPVKVELKNENGNWKLYRGGQPYFIKGAGGYEYMDRIAAYGGNSVRTWGYDNAEKILDEAQKNGLTVMLGLWVGCERQGFDYDDTAAVKNQLKIFTEAVKKYRNHPALLLWGVGNEMDLQYTNPKVWNAVEDICKMIHALDPNHPAVTVTAGFHQEVMDEIIKRVPSLDIYGVNTYADLPNMPERIAKSGWKGPFIVTEWGATGQWECAKTAWNQPIEETSKEKSKVYYERCQKGIIAAKDKCLGSYVFLWGHKQEVTSTWYGFFTLKGEQSEVVDVIQYLWSGKFPENKAPSLDSFFLDKKTSLQNIYLYPGNLYAADVYINSNNNKKLKYVWEVREESTDRKSGGDAEADPPEVSGCIKNKGDNSVFVKAPLKEGEYRLYVKVFNGENKFCYANIPFYVKPADPSLPQPQKVKFKNYDLKSFENDNK